MKRNRSWIEVRYAERPIGSIHEPRPSGALSKSGRSHLPRERLQ